jgi:formylglycine-generating enzyme required for sulfatase activity
MQKRRQTIRRRRSSLRGRGKSQKKFVKSIRAKQASKEPLTKEEWEYLQKLSVQTKNNIEKAIKDYKNELGRMAGRVAPVNNVALKEIANEYSLNPDVIRAELKKKSKK